MQNYQHSAFGFENSLEIMLNSEIVNIQAKVDKLSV